MVHQFADATGRKWRAETTGLSRDVMGLRAVSISFIDDAIGWRVYGGLNPADAEHPTDVRMREALREALEQQVEGKPAVIKVESGPPEMFQINDSRFMRMVRNPDKA